MFARWSQPYPQFGVSLNAHAGASAARSLNPFQFNGFCTLCTNWSPKISPNSFRQNCFRTLAKTTEDDAFSIGKFPSRISNPNLCRTEHPVKDANPEKRRDEGSLSLTTNLAPLASRNLQRPFIFNHLRTPANWNFCVSPAFPIACALLLENTGGGGANC